MKLQLDPGQPVAQTAGSLAHAALWIVGQPAGDPASVAQPAWHRYSYRYSYMSECECPNDCLRDHENE